MLTFDSFGNAMDARIKVVNFPIGHGDLRSITGIIVHQTDSPTAEATFNAYKSGGNGAHFLIDKDGTVYQTLPIKKKAHHVGWLKSRCLAEHTCNPAELAALKGKRPGREIGQIELQKTSPRRYPSNNDSIGIEIVGQATSKAGHKEKVFESLTDRQQESLKWLVEELLGTLKVSVNEVFRHPAVSWKNETEAASARW